MRTSLPPQRELTTVGMGSVSSSHPSLVEPYPLEKAPGYHAHPPVSTVQLSALPRSTTGRSRSASLSSPNSRHSRHGSYNGLSLATAAEEEILADPTPNTNAATGSQEKKNRDSRRARTHDLARIAGGRCRSRARHGAAKL